MTRTTLIALAGVATAALAACGGPEPAPADTVSTSSSSVADMTPEQGLNVAALWGGGRPAPMDLQVVHPNGTVLQVTSIQSKPTETVVGVTVVNGDDSEVSLNRFSNNKDGFLVSSTGEKLYISPPAGNPAMSVPAGQTMQGELVFLGRLPRQGDVTLVLNEGSGNSEHTSTPSFNVPLPLSGAAFSDDGSKKN